MVDSQMPFPLFLYKATEVLPLKIIPKSDSFHSRATLCHYAPLYNPDELTQTERNPLTGSRIFVPWKFSASDSITQQLP